MRPRIIVYESVVNHEDLPRFLAFLVQPDKKGNPVVLPVHFSSDSAQGAREAALAFWDVETAKAKAKSERGAKLASLRGMPPP